MSPQERAKRMELERIAQLEAPALYKHAHEKLVHGSFADASQEFDTLMSKYPFSRYATQAQLEQIYALYRSFKPEEALGAAMRFLQQHPRHPHVDYVLYLEGLINTARNQSLTRHLGIKQSERDVSSLSAAFQDFALMVARFPDSPYVADARQRMIALRNEIAEHELDITRFYLKRGAWVAAARRAQNIIENFPGAPQTARALLIMKTCYTKLGLTDQVAQVDTLIQANQASFKAAGIKAGTDTATTAIATAPPPPDAASPAAASSRSASTGHASADAARSTPPNG